MFEAFTYKILENTFDLNNISSLNTNWVGYTVQSQ